jgi:outer membrane protein assembly factor BamD
MTPMSLTSVSKAALAARGLALALAAVVLTGCSWFDKSDKDSQAAQYVERPIDQIYKDAWRQVDRGNWSQAAKQFDEVERQHPYSVWARRAMLISAFCSYKANKYTDAIGTAEQYIQLHPGSQDVAYAFYIRAISYYEQIVDVGRDQSNSEQALSALNDVVQRFPDSEYAHDATLKVDLVLDHLAGKEMTVGRYYLTRNEYIGAINRFKVVVQQYQTTSQTPEALERLTEAYFALGITKEAQTAAAVLGANYPGSRWYQDSYNLLTSHNLKPQEDKGSWISRAFDKML